MSYSVSMRRQHRPRSSVTLGGIGMACSVWQSTMRVLRLPRNFPAHCCGSFSPTATARRYTSGLVLNILRMRENGLFQVMIRRA